MTSHPTFGYLAGVIPSTPKRNTALYTAQPSELAEGTVIVTHKNPYPTKIRILVVDQNDYDPSGGGAPSPQNFTFVTGAAPGEYQLTGTDRVNTYAGDANASININEGDTITFDNTATYASHPMYIRVSDQGNSVTYPAATGEGTATVSWTPTTAGTYYYQCGSHPAMIGTITVTASSGTTSVPQVATKSFCYFNIFVGEGQTFETQTMYVSDQQSILVWSDRPDTNFVFQGSVVTLPETGSGLIASKVIAKEDKQEILLSNGSDDQKTVSVFACNKGADVARIRMGVADSGRPYPYIESTEYYDFNIKLSPGQTYVRTNIRVGSSKDVIVRADSKDVNWVALGTSNFEATTQVSIALPGNLSVGGTSTFQGESSFIGDIDFNSPEIDYTLSVLRGYNVSDNNTWYIDSNNGSAFFGDVNLSGNITSTGGITINDANGYPVFTVDPVTGDVNVGGALSAGTFNYEISIDGDLDLLNNRVINMAEPQAASDAATRRYVDNYAIIYAVALS